jgi:hypothetical protein
MAPVDYFFAKGRAAAPAGKRLLSAFGRNVRQPIRKLDEAKGSATMGST